MGTTATERTEQSLQSIADAGAEGKRIFIPIYTESTLAQAHAADARAAAGITLGPTRQQRAGLRQD